jgi:predicted alpha/beta superfamily hydrolase
MMRLALPALLLSLSAANIQAGEPITIGETIVIRSDILDEERTVLVSTPPGYDRSTELYPVLYVTDGDAHLLHTRGTADFLAGNGLMPRIIIVGVANTDRTRDLSPTRASLEGRNGTIREFPTSGGASRFLDFFEKELFPYVEAHYRTQPHRLLAGHSFGGLFALNAFFTRPAMFRSVLAVSPTLRWDEDLPLRQAADFFDHRDELGATLVVAMANEEEGDPRPTRLDRLEKTLEAAKAEGFEWQVLRIPGENHGSVVLRAHYWGLRKSFEPWPLPADPETGAFAGSLDDLKRHYAGLSQRYGYAVVPPEDVVNQFGYQFLGRDDVEGALAVFGYNVELHPEAANVHDSLGEALERAGRLAEAFSAYSRAVEKAAAGDDPRLQIFMANRDRVKGQL